MTLHVSEHYSTVLPLCKARVNLWKHQQQGGALMTNLRDGLGTDPGIAMFMK